MKDCWLELTSDNRCWVTGDECNVAADEGGSTVATTDPEDGACQITAGEVAGAKGTPSTLARLVVARVSPVCWEINRGTPNCDAGV